MEIRWHLRHSNPQRVEVLVQPKYEDEVREIPLLEPGWDFASETVDGVVKAVLTKRR